MRDCSVLRNHLEGGRGQAKLLQLITIDRGGGDGEILHCKNVCRLLARKIWGFKEASIGKTSVLIKSTSRKALCDQRFKILKVLEGGESVPMTTIDYIGKPEKQYNGPLPSSTIKVT